MPCLPAQVLDALKAKGISIRQVTWSCGCAVLQVFVSLACPAPQQPSSHTPCCHPPLDPACCRVASPKLVMEEAPESYKDVSEVVDTCHNAGISRKAVKLRPIAVVKG